MKTGDLLVLSTVSSFVSGKAGKLMEQILQFILNTDISYSHYLKLIMFFFSFKTLDEAVFKVRRIGDTK